VNHVAAKRDVLGLLGGASASMQSSNELHCVFVQGIVSNQDSELLIY